MLRLSGRGCKPAWAVITGPDRRAGPAGSRRRWGRGCSAPSRWQRVGATSAAPRPGRCSSCSSSRGHNVTKDRLGRPAVAGVRHPHHHPPALHLRRAGPRACPADVTSSRGRWRCRCSAPGGSRSRRCSASDGVAVITSVVVGGDAGVIVFGVSRLLDLAIAVGAAAGALAPGWASWYRWRHWRQASRPPSRDVPPAGPVRADERPPP
jgi:hypothetical protein